MKIIFLILLFSAVVSAAWIKQTVPTTAAFRGLSVVSANVVWASGTGGTVVRTVDGGKSWQVFQVPGAEKLDFRDVEAFDANTAYVLSIGEGESSRIYKTNDGGANWTLQFQNKNKDAFFDALAFWDKDHGIAMSDPVGGKYLLITTSDGGANWKELAEQREEDGRLSGRAMAGPASEHAPAVAGQAAFAASGTCIIARGGREAFIVTGGAASRVYRSSDRGRHWLTADSPLPSGESAKGIFSIAMFDAKNGVIVGGDYQKPNDATNAVAFTTDGGATWTLGSGVGGYRSGVAYLDRKTLIAVGTSGSDISYDGGRTWKLLDKENYNAVAAKGKKSVWAVGPKGLVSQWK